MLTPLMIVAEPRVEVNTNLLVASVMPSMQKY